MTHGMTKKRTSETRASRQPRLSRKPASDFGPELTAQPHPLSDDIVAAATDEGGLSVAPDELGSHFLSEAVQQGDLAAREAAELEFAWNADPEAAERPSTEISAWTQMVDLAVERETSAALLEAADLGAERLETEREPVAEPTPDDRMSLADSSIRDVSLLDHEGAAAGEVVSPDIDLEQTGRHARSTSRGALGEQVRGGSEPPAATSGKPRSTSKLKRAAGKLKRVAKQLSHASHR